MRSLLFRLIVSFAVLFALASILLSQGRWNDVIVHPISLAFGDEAAAVATNIGNAIPGIQNNVSSSANEVAAAVDDSTPETLSGNAGETVPAVLGTVNMADVNPAATASAMLAALDTIPQTSSERHEAYDRVKDFGSWTDPDPNDGKSCDARQLSLAHDLVNVTYSDGSKQCKVASGILHDRYSGKDITFTYGVKTSSAVQADHVLSLHQAWDLGAWKWTKAQRVAYANDITDVLWSVDGPLNGAKSDLGPSQWLPPMESFHCTFAAKYTYIAVKYHLTLENADRAKLKEILTTCN